MNEPRLPRLSGLDFRKMSELTIKIESGLTLPKFITVDVKGEFFLWNNPELLNGESLDGFIGGHYVGWIEQKDVLE